MATHKTTKGRRKLQKNKATFTKAREELQLNGHLETTPEGALKNERVDPTTQDEQRFPGLDRMAIRNGKGWGVNEHIKRMVVEKAAEVLFAAPQTYKDADGNEKPIPPDRYAQAQASKTLLAADKMEHDIEDEKSDININNNINVVTWDRMAQPVQQVIDPVEEKLKEIEALANKGNKDGAKDQRKDVNGAT